MTETAMERLQTEVVLMELDGRVPTLASDIRAVLAVVEELDSLVGLLEADGCLDSPEDLDDAKTALAALHSQASDEGKT